MLANSSCNMYTVQYMYSFIGAVTRGIWELSLRKKFTILTLYESQQSLLLCCRSYRHYITSSHKRIFAESPQSSTHVCWIKKTAWKNSVLLFFVVWEDKNSHSPFYTVPVIFFTWKISSMEKSAKVKVSCRTYGILYEIPSLWFDIFIAI